MGKPGRRREEAPEGTEIHLDGQPGLCRILRNDNALSFGLAPTGQGPPQRGRFGKYYAVMCRILDSDFAEHPFYEVG